MGFRNLPTTRPTGIPASLVCLAKATMPSSSLWSSFNTKSPLSSFPQPPPLERYQLHAHGDRLRTFQKNNLQSCNDDFVVHICPMARVGIEQEPVTDAGVEIAASLRRAEPSERFAKGRTSFCPSWRRSSCLWATGCRLGTPVRGAGLSRTGLCYIPGSC